MKTSIYKERYSTSEKMSCSKKPDRNHETGGSIIKDVDLARVSRDCYMIRKGNTIVY